MLNLATTDLTFSGPALPEAFVQHELEAALGKALPSAREAEPAWHAQLKSLREPLTSAGSIRIRNVILGPLVKGLGYGEMTAADDVRTREGDESGGLLLRADGAHLRAWAVGYEDDLDAPTERGLNHRFSPGRIAERVLLASGERLGLLTNGIELRLIFSDPARRASFASFSLSQLKQYRSHDPVPDSFRLLLAFASPAGQKALPEVIEQARLKQGQVTKDLRVQARKAIEAFVQGVLDHPANRETLGRYSAQGDTGQLAKQLWRESLIMVYRFLFILRGESGGRETPAFSFASTSLWRNTYSPSRAQPGNLAWVAQKVREEGMASGQFLEAGLRALFQAFEHGLDSTELHLAPLGGALFGEKVTPLLDELQWGEQGCAELLDNLLRAPRGKGKARSLVRISYRDLDVEELGRVYEALLELEPGITSEPMVRLRRAKLEVVVPEAQGAKYRRTKDEERGAADENTDEESDESEDESEIRNPLKREIPKSKIEWVEAIPPNCFYLRVGLGRKSSGGHYTPDSFVRFLVQETLGPLCDKRSPADDPQPMAILRLNVLDGAMGSGHILVGACRFLGERLYDACRACAERGLWERMPEEIAPYLPGRRPEGESEAGLSAERAHPLCKRLVAVHCLYGVDKNPLAVQLARVSLWLESFAEGLPLTFLDHRLVCGDSLLGPMNILGEGADSPMTPPYTTTPIDVALAQGVRAQLRERLGTALQKVRELDTTVGVSVEDLLAKQKAKADVDAALAPFIDLCVAWSGGVMLGQKHVDEDGYRDAMRLAVSGEWSVERGALSDGFFAMLNKGREAGVLVYPLVFPEVFFPTGDVEQMAGFDVVLGNPPWDKVRPKAREFFAGYDFDILATPTKRERTEIEKRLLEQPDIKSAYTAYNEEYEHQHHIHDQLFDHQVAVVNGERTGGDPDASKLFLERFAQLVKQSGLVGVVIPSAFHANEGFTGVRQLYLKEMALQCCYSFENRRKLFEIDSRFKFALVIARKDSKGTSEFSCAFYLHDDDWLFERRDAFTYSLDFVSKTGGGYLSFLEPGSAKDLAVIASASSQGKVFHEYVTAQGIVLNRELDTTDDAWRFVPVSQVLDDSDIEPRNPDIVRSLVQKGFLLLAEGKAFHQYTDIWADATRYVVPLAKIPDKPVFAETARYYRVSYRTFSASTNERTAIFCVLPPGYTTCRNSPSDVATKRHPCWRGLELCAVANSFAFDFLLRLYVSSATLNYFFLARTPYPDLQQAARVFATHCALRLVCNHAGYAPLWAEQLGDEWRESTPRFTWPVLAGNNARWHVRAAIDAVVAQAYGLSREQYAHVLSTFSHKSYPRAPELCLGKFDELSAIGLDAFTRKYDPYWDVPLVETLPQPVIELPSLAEKEGKQDKGQKDLFGQPVPTNLFGEITQPKRSRRGKR